MQTFTRARALPLAAAAIGILAATEPAAAQYRRGQPYLEAPAASSGPPIWAGLSVGIDGGYDWATARPASGGTLKGDGGLVGARIGYDWQFNRFVVGVETDLMATWAEGSRAYPAEAMTVRNNWLSSFRLRAGYSFDRVLVYATGGLALGDFEALGTSGWRSSQIYSGYAVGAGLETMLTRNLSARLEVMHMGFGNKDLELVAGDPKADLGTTMVKVGLTYRFN